MTAIGAAGAPDRTDPGQLPRPAWQLGGWRKVSGAEIRAWPRANGNMVADENRIPAEVLAVYGAAHRRRLAAHGPVAGDPKPEPLAPPPPATRGSRGWSTRDVTTDAGPYLGPGRVEAFDLAFLSPTEGSWRDGYRKVTCMVRALDGGMVFGSAKAP